MLYYTGIGSRQTPPEILQHMTHMATQFASQGWILRSGHAPGADQAFEKGAGNHCEIYLPWSGFQSHVPLMGNPFREPTNQARNLVAAFHPRWSSLSSAVQKLHARNGHQVLGWDLKSPSQFLICWTQDGAETTQETSASTGGTGIAIRIAHHHRIPVYNLQRPGRLEKISSRFSLINKDE